MEPSKSNNNINTNLFDQMRANCASAPPTRDFQNPKPNYSLDTSQPFGGNLQTNMHFPTLLNENRTLNPNPTTNFTPISLSNHLHLMSTYFQNPQSIQSNLFPRLGSTSTGTSTPSQSPTSSIPLNNGTNIINDTNMNISNNGNNNQYNMYPINPLPLNPMSHPYLNSLMLNNNVLGVPIIQMPTPLVNSPTTTTNFNKNDTNSYKNQNKLSPQGYKMQRLTAFQPKRIDRNNNQSNKNTTNNIRDNNVSNVNFESTKIIGNTNIININNNNNTNNNNSNNNSDTNSNNDDSKTYYENKTQLYKTELCTNWTLTHTCSYGNKCHFAHGHQDLKHRIRSENYKTQMCCDPARSGPRRCMYGNRCNYCHPGEALRKSFPKQYYDKEYFEAIEKEFPGNKFPLGIYI